jgi:hypothetical protein
MSLMLDVALGYLDRGVSILPIDPGTKEPPKGLPWKRYQSKLPTRATVQRWFRNDCYNVACIMGPVSGGLASRDFDQAESYARWADRHAPLAKSLPTVETVRGFHVYFRAEPTGRSYLTLPDGELRLERCYNLAPLSTHPKGKRYTWRIPFHDNLPTIGDFVEAGLVPATCNRENGGVSRHMGEGGEGEANDVGDEQETTSSTKPSEIPTHSPNQCLEYSLDSLSSLLHERVELAIARTIPTTGGRRHKAIFEFARELKALPEFIGADAKSMKALIRAWHTAACPYIRTKYFEESWADFAEGWGKVRNPKGQEPIHAMFASAAANIPEVAKQYEQPELQRLVALCRILQQGAGDQPFFLATRVAGELLGVSYPHASRWLRLLQVDEVLQLVELGTVGKRRASRFRYLGD